MAGVSNYTNIVAALVSVLTAAGCPIVHTRERLRPDWASFISQFVDPVTGKVDTVTISRTATAENRETNMENATSDTFKIGMFMSVNEEDDSETALQLRIEDIRNKFREGHTLGGTCEYNDPLQVVRVGFKRFGGVLVHVAELQVTVHELILGGP